MTTSTLDEFRDARPRAPRDNTPQLRMLAQEAPRMKALTGDDVWDHFLSYLEASLQYTERLADSEMQKLRSPHLVNDEQIRICKANITALESRIATLNEVMHLPKLLKEKGALAQAQIADLALANTPMPRGA